MAKFSDSSNTRARSPRQVEVKANCPARIVKNAAGGNAFAQSDKLALVSLMLSNMLSGDMYSSDADVLSRLKALVHKVDPEFAAKAALYARNEFGMRSTSHVLAGELATANATSGKPWARDFYNAVIYRVDDMMEILGYYLAANKDKPLPNALKAGLAEAFKRFDAYQLAKYKGDGRAVKLVDVVRLVRPKPTAKNADALAKLLKGELKNTQTWEAKISAAGQQKDAAEKASARNEAWADLLKENKLGYLALVRNLTNIAQDADDATFDLAMNALVNREQIKQSKIFPFQIYTAYREVESNGRIGNGKSNRIATIMDRLAQALDLSCDNVPEMPGKTLVAIDISGSMDSMVANMNSTNCVTLATLFGVILAKANNADVVRFQTSAEYTPVLKSRSTLDTVKMLAHTSGGTSFESIFKLINGKKYDRIFILSDMQAWIQSDWSPKTTFQRYKASAGADPYIYSFDLKGHGTMQFPEAGEKVVALAGFSEKVFDLIKNSEMDKNALISAIEAYPIQVVRKNKTKEKVED